MIPMVNLKAQYAEIKSEIEQGMNEVLESCAFIMGPNVQAFEQAQSKYSDLNTSEQYHPCCRWSRRLRLPIPSAEWSAR